MMKRKKNKNKSIIQLYNFIKKRYSKEFIDLICNCLRFDPDERPSPKSLLSHAFFKKDKGRNQTSPDVTL